MKSRFCLASVLVIATALAANAQQQSPACPLHEKHMAAQAKAQGQASDSARQDSMSEMNERGDKAMGFQQSKTTHHFRLLKDGGAIEIAVNDAQDETSRASIREHLAHIARAFSDGDFDLPLFIHDQVPPGVPLMKQLKTEIKYEFEKTERGGRVRIKTGNAAALAAVQDFLRFQIKEHQTEK